MTHHENFLLKFSIFAFICLILCSQLLPYIRFNGSETAFQQSGQENTTEMKRLISTGAGYFLRSQSDF
ncbi:MAG: hypothetical protein JSV88_04705, partial [Candidatus Aminicenantes bacterium]